MPRYGHGDGSDIGTAAERQETLNRAPVGAVTSKLGGWMVGKRGNGCVIKLGMVMMNELIRYQ